MPDTIATVTPAAPSAETEINALMLHTAGRVYAAIAEKRGAAEILDLVEHGFAQQFLERNWTRIAVAGDRIAGERRARKTIGARR